MLRTLLIAALLASTTPTLAQTTLKVTQIAELAEGLAQPHDAAFSPDGKLIYITDMRNSRIRVVEAMTLQSLGVIGEGELSYPHDAEFDGAGRLLVADTGNNRVAIYQTNGARATLVGQLTGLAGPEGVAVAPDGRVLVTNTRNGTLSVFRDDKLVQTIGQQGRKDGEFANPHDIEVAADGNVYVVDSGNNRVQMLTATLAHRRSVGNELGLNGPKYVGFDGEKIWLADEYNHRILLLNRELELKGIVGSGERGRAPDVFYQPEAVLARAPYLWVIDTYNNRIVLLRVE